MTRSIFVRDAVEEDVREAVVVLRRTISESCVLDHGGNAETLSSWLANKTEGQMSDWLRNRSLYLKVALIECTVVGVGMCTAAGEISLCYVLPNLHRSGIGRAIVNELENTLSGLGVTRSVLVSTLTGLKFYSHIGYEISGKIMNSNGVNGIPMRRDLCTPRTPFC